MTAMNQPDSVPEGTVLRGRRVQLEPFTEAHIPALLAIGQATPEAFQLTSTPTSQTDADAYYGTVLRNRELGIAYPFTISLLESGEVIGMSRYNALNFTDRNTEIGYTWYRPDQHGTASNVDAKLLMLDFAFSELKLHRVSLRTDVDNHQSRRAILALGAKEEGIMRRHMRKRDGSLRDTVLYAIIDEEWPELKARNLERLERKLRG